MAETKKRGNPMEWVLLIIAVILIAVGVLLLEGAPVAGIICIIIGVILLLILATTRFRKAKQKQE